MALTGVKYCKSPVPDTKKQSNRPTMYEPIRLLTTATSTMHQSKSMDYPFVHLTGHKLVDGPCIPSHFDIISGQTNFGDFDKSHSFTKNSNFKSYSQFPLLSFSQLVGGFVGSKSQFGSKNRESHQIWDIVLQKLDEFINCRPTDTEKYSQHYYEFSTLPQDIIGSFYKKPNSTLSYILKEGCQSLKTAKSIDNITNSSPVSQNAVENSPTTVDTSVSLDSFVPSHSSCNKLSVPVILDIVEQFVSQPDLTQQTTNVPVPVLKTEPSEAVRAHQDSLVATSLCSEPSVCCEIPEVSLNLDLCQEMPSLALSEGKQSYAEVAKMTRIKPKAGKWRPATSGPIASSKHHRMASTRNNFSRNCQDSNQRSIDSSNWRSHRVSSVPVQKGIKKNASKEGCSEKTLNCNWKSDSNSKSSPTRISQSHRRRNHEGLKHFKHFKGSSLKTVHEMGPSNTAKDISHGTKSFCCHFPTVDEYSCQSNNLNKKSCANWRCRQPLQKSSVKRDMKFVLKDNAIEENSNDQTVNSDLSPSPTEGSVRLNTLENYIKPPLNNSRIFCKSLKNSMKPRCDSKSEVQSLPVISKNDDSVVTSVDSKDNCDLTRLSESSDSSSARSQRSSSESSDVIKVPRSRSISEESKASSTSTSSLNSCKLMLDANFRRRFSSECDSEDSFVVFEGGVVDCDDYDLDSDSDFSEEDEEEFGDFESEDECDSENPCVSVLICIPLQGKEVESNTIMPNQSPKMEDVNRRWERNCSSQQMKPSCEKLTCKKVSFASNPALETVHRMVKWDYAYRAARCGPWEEIARDRDRFRQRVDRSEPVLASVLRADHRDRVYAMLRTAGRHDVSSESALR